MIRSRWLAGVLVLGTALMASAQTPGPIDTAGWQTFRADAMGFELKYPATWRIGRSTGTLESVLLGGPAQGGGTHVSMQLIIQRGINPRELSVEQWYADQLRRFAVSTPPPTTRTVIGGRPTIRRETNGSLGKHYDFYTAINRSDIFQATVILPSGHTRLDPLQEAVISTLTFLR